MKTVTVQQPMNELWVCTLQEVMTAQDQSRKQLGFWPSFTKAQKDGSRKDVSQTVNQARPSAKLLPGSKLGQDVAAGKLGFFGGKAEILGGSLREQAGGCLQVDQEM